MKAAIILLIVLLAARAGPAPRRAPTADATGLRGPISAGEANAAAPATVTTGAAAKLRKAATRPPSLASPLPADGGQCRQTCAHGYYRCLAGDYAEQCPQVWTLCLAGCARAATDLP